MLETIESDVQIILSIREGRGFDQVLQPTLLIGTLNGHSLETVKIESSPNPQYATDLIWETNKTTLRKMRSGQVPLKLECFAFKENESKERIGYILLNIRSAQITSRHGNLSPKANWHKLLGLRSDLKMHKPELFLMLKIEDRKSANAVMEIKNPIVENDIILQNNKLVPYLNPDEQLIQLGSPNICCELFLLSITILYIENLHLLYEHLTKDSTICFLYQVLENDIELRPFKIDGEIHSPNEKVIVRIRSSLKMLRYYLLSKPHLLIFLKHDASIIAESLVNLQSLVPMDNLQEFLKCTINASTNLHERCFLTKSGLTEKFIEDKHQKPFLDIQITLQYIGNKMHVTHNSDSIINVNNHIISNTQYCNEEIMNNNQERPDIESHKNSNGDCGKFKSAGMPYEKNCMVECKYVNEQVTNCQCSRNRIDKVMYSHSCDKTLCNCINKNYMKDAGSYHCYCLNILLLTITPISPKLSERHIEFRFHHPKADIMSVAHTITPVLNEKSKLQNIECQFHFISKADEIKQLLQSFPPKLSVYDTEEDDKLLSQIMLDIKPLFYQDQPECQYKSPLYDTDQNKIGDIDIILKLENRGPHFILKKEITDKNLGPPILDDSLAYKLVDELETWKERQKEMFKVDLKKKEERHLNILSEEWRRQKDNLETKLACSVEQCKILANSLNNATEDLRMRRLKSLENENRLIKANEDLKWTYEAKLQEFKDSLHVTQNDLTSKMNKLEEKKAALEAQVEILFYENESLKSLISKQIEELQMYQKGSLSQDQTTSLLQELKILEEKLDNAQKGKSFFKEQWGKAVREIHRMKMNHKEAMQIQIKNSKEELKNVDLAEILSIDTKALTNDQILLNELQKEIDVMKPIQSFASKETHSQVFTPVNNICSKISYDSNKILPDKSEGYNKRLQALKEERDSLLKTGSYAADDVVIKKLNTEMRYLLVNK